jgi:hypothetical protein
MTGEPWRPVVVLAAALILGAAGCAGNPEFDHSTQYTPESLAQELAFRYSALSPDGKASTKARSRKPQKKAVDSKADEQSPTKSQSKAAKKKDLPKTIDDVLDDIEIKADLVKGMSRAETFERMADVISRDNSLRESDRQLLAQKLKEMGGG